MNCPECGSKENRTAITNGHLPDEVVRRRVCSTCKHAWYTVEMRIPHYAIGWCERHKNQSKPVLRASLTLQPSFVEPFDLKENLAKANAARWKKWAVENGEYS